MSNFGETWQRPPRDGFAENLQGLLKKDKPLKPRIDSAVKGLNQPISKLNKTANQLSEKEKKLFNKIVEAKQKGNIQEARILATELSQIRKTENLIDNMKLSVERTQLRLSTTSTIGDAIVSMKPAVSTMKAVVPTMNNVLSQASGEIESMGGMLGDMMPGSIGDSAFEDSSVSSAETDSILQEAAAVAETKIGDKFPSVPSGSNLGNSSMSSSGESF